MRRQFHPVLVEVAAAINSTLVVEEVLGRIVETTGRAIEAKGCGLLLLTPDRGRFEYAASWGLSARYTDKGPIAADERLAAILGGQPELAKVAVPTRRSPRSGVLQYPEAAQEEGIAAVYSVPLRYHGEVMGILRLYLADARACTPREREFLAAVADLSAIAIANARSHEAVQKQMEDARQELLEWYADLRTRPRADAPAPAFAHPSEEEFARLLDFYRVRWRYEPRSFALQWDGDRILEMFTPDFYLPDLDLYIELTTLRQRLVTYKNRKLRHLREMYPDINIRLLYRRDYHRLLEKYGYKPITEDEHAAEVDSVLFSAAQIQERVNALGAEISRDYVDLNPLLVGVLNMALSSYGQGAAETVRIQKDISRSIAGRHVLVVEDIIDTGMTLNFLLGHLRNAGAASIEVCTLLDKRVRRLAPISIKYTAFEVPDEFVVGYGLDYQEAYRHLPFIGVLKSDSSERQRPHQPPQQTAEQTAAATNAAELAATAG
ncbi:MAG: phosphoribosyltransferase family protein [Chloroflexi bacterium]|nr:phosphoribosyltransferase family protein [Chloroflexota bacterium]